MLDLLTTHATLPDGRSDMWVAIQDGKIVEFTHGLQARCNADMVLLQARDPVEAIRLRAKRLKVWRRGQLLASSPKAAAALHIPGRSGEVNWQ
jgi:hypothetical protein